MARKKHAAKKTARRRPIRGSQKFVARKPPSRRRVPPRSTAPRKTMVIVHGAGSFPDDYYKPLVAAIEQRLGGVFSYVPVYYADVTNPPATVLALAAPVPDSPAAAQFKQDLMAEMQRSYAASLQSRRAAGVTVQEVETLDVSCIGLVQIIVKEVGQYLFTPGIAAQIQARLVAGLDQAARQSDAIVLASLSLGTVVSIDVLRQFADRYEISYWFTTGCPLGKLRRVGVRPANLGAIKPANVTRWYNLYDTTDIIAEAIGPQFPAYRLHDIYVEVGNDPVSAHDYFNNGETLDLLADAMR